MSRQRPKRPRRASTRGQTDREKVVSQNQPAEKPKASPKPASKPGRKSKAKPKTKPKAKTATKTKTESKVKLKQPDQPSDAETQAAGLGFTADELAQGQKLIEQEAAAAVSVASEPETKTPAPEPTPEPDVTDDPQTAPPLPKRSRSETPAVVRFFRTYALGAITFVLLALWCSREASAATRLQDATLTAVAALMSQLVATDKRVTSPRIRHLAPFFIAAAVCKSGQLLGFGAAWEGVVSNIGRAMRLVLQTPDRPSYPATLAAVTEGWIALAGQPVTVSVLLLFNSGDLRDVGGLVGLPARVRMVAVAVAGTVLAFLIVNAIIGGIVYWFLWEPLLALAVVATGRAQGIGVAVLARALAAASSITYAVIDRDRILRAVAHVYVHTVRRAMLGSRVRAVHSYAKADDDRMSGFVLSNIHMQVLETIERPFRATLSAERFMAQVRTEPAARRTIKRIKSWFGKMSVAASTSKLADALAKHHGIPASEFPRNVRRVPLHVNRYSAFQSAAEQIMAADPRDLACGIDVKFDNESGVDSGGLTTEFFRIITDSLLPASDKDGDSARASMDGDEDDFIRPPPLLRRQSSVRGAGQPMFKSLPDTSLMLCPSDRPIFYYKALGRVFGMCVLYNCRGDAATIPASLSTSLLKFLLRREINHTDVRAIDPDYFRNRMEYMLAPGGVRTMCDILGEDAIYFVADDDTELKPGGRSLRVTEQNKIEYVALLSEFYLVGRVRRQVSQFLQGFWSIVPLQLLKNSNFDETTLSLSLSGIPCIDVDNWEKHSKGTVQQYQPELWRWFWEVVREMPLDVQLKLLQFSTGLTRIPPVGFGDLKPLFQVELNTSVEATHLPTAHTCFNTLSLPDYKSKADLKSKLKMAMALSSNEFGMM